MPKKTRLQKQLARNRRTAPLSPIIKDNQQSPASYVYSFASTTNSPPPIKKAETIVIDGIDAIRKDITKAVTFAGIIIGIEILLSRIM